MCLELYEIQIFIPENLLYFQIVSFKILKNHIIRQLEEKYCLQVKKKGVYYF